jgi:hypothetical protein
MTKVQCRWGAVGIEIKAEPIVQFFCHCDDFQAVHGGAYSPESVYPADAVKVVRGDPMSWKPKRNPRVTCRECGARLFTDVEAPRLRGVNGFLLSAGKFEPAFHVQRQFAVWPVVDDSRIIRACRRVSDAQTRWLDGSASAPPSLSCHARERGHPANGVGGDGFPLSQDDKTAGSARKRDAQNL